MSKTVNDWAELKKEIMRRARKSLKTNVADVVKIKIDEHIGTDVYNTYNPVVYERRWGNGIRDFDNMQVEVDSKTCTLSVRDVAPLEGPRLNSYKSYEENNLAGLIEHGAYNPWAKYGARDGAWTEPRPFMTNAQKDIKEHPEDIIQELKNDIENGI